MTVRITKNKAIRSTINKIYMSLVFIILHITILQLYDFSTLSIQSNINIIVKFPSYNIIPIIINAKIAHKTLLQIFALLMLSPLEQIKMRTLPSNCVGKKVPKDANTLGLYCTGVKVLLELDTLGASCTNVELSLKAFTLGPDCTDKSSQWTPML